LQSFMYGPKGRSTAGLQRGGVNRGDSGGWLRRQLEREIVEQKLEFGLWLGVADELDLPAVGGGHKDVDHLHGGELLAACRSLTNRQPLITRGSQSFADYAGGLAATPIKLLDGEKDAPLAAETAMVGSDAAAACTVSPP